MVFFYWQEQIIVNNYKQLKAAVMTEHTDKSLILKSFLNSEKSHQINCISVQKKILLRPYGCGKTFVYILYTKVRIEYGNIIANAFWTFGRHCIVSIHAEVHTHIRFMFRVRYKVFLEIPMLRIFFFGKLNAPAQLPHT